MPLAVASVQSDQSQDLSGASGTTSRAAEIMRSLPELLRTRAELRDGGTWAVAAREIAERLNPGSGLVGEVPCQLTPLKIAVLGEKGALYHDIIGASGGRELAQSVAARSQAIILVADHHIDELGWVASQRVETLRNLMSSVSDGRIVTMPTLQLTRAAELGAELHATLRTLPGGSLFVNEFGALAEAVCRQIEDRPTLELCAEVGGRVSALSALASCLVEPKVDPRIIHAARHWGAYIGLTDDIRDLEADIASGNPSCLSVSENPTRLRIEAQKLAALHFAAAYELLPEAGRAKLTARHVLSTDSAPALLAL